ncbi:ABC transporter permease subunit [Occultella glacieicola]|uniref:ABC transporter permease subunit n=1 Tax=Occultella glacieicola TaxID=2518684 RepID=A0ABY2E8B2_9MICO|nr:ABC transporter permease subunit [Occultella glacieicola]TDE97227.1 ABC transporter permease subunit [Occultella glacieicola]
MNLVARRVLPPVVLGVVALVIWQATVTVLAIPELVLPSPSAILAETLAYLPVLVSAALVTGWNALVGLVIGSVLGIALALVAANARVFDELTVPLVAALAVIPIVALAPVLYTMFGADLQSARQVVAGISVFVPVFLNTLRGLRQTRPVHRDLMRAYAATRRQAMRTVTLPTARPFIFTGLRIASSLSVIAALVAEYFGGPRGGLGTFITASVAGSDYARAWSYVLASIVLGLIFYLAALAVETLALRRRPA